MQMSPRMVTWPAGWAAEPTAPITTRCHHLIIPIRRILNVTIRRLRWTLPSGPSDKHPVPKVNSESKTSLIWLLATMPATASRAYHAGRDMTWRAGWPAATKAYAPVVCMRSPCQAQPHALRHPSLVTRPPLPDCGHSPPLQCIGFGQRKSRIHRQNGIWLSACPESLFGMPS